MKLQYAEVDAKKKHKADSSLNVASCHAFFTVKKYLNIKTCFPSAVMIFFSFFSRRRRVSIQPFVPFFPTQCVMFLKRRWQKAKYCPFQFFFILVLQLISEIQNEMNYSFFFLPLSTWFISSFCSSLSDLACLFLSVHFWVSVEIANKNGAQVIKGIFTILK